MITSVRADRENGARLLAAGEYAHALAVFEQSLTDTPDDTHLLFSAGHAAHALGRTEQAVALLQRCLAVNPLHVQALVELGTVLDWALRRHDAAERCYRLAMKLSAADYKSRFHLGVEMMFRGAFDEARTLIAEAIRLAPADPILYRALAQIEYEMGHSVESLQMLDRLLEVSPEVSETLMQRSIVLLRMGRFAEGFRHYRHRYALQSGADGTMRHPAAGSEQASYFPLPGPMLEPGESIDGRTILVADEQGAGDTLNFLRYLRLLREAGARVILLLCDTRLERLLRRADAADAIVLQDDFLRGAPVSFDRSIYLMDLPWFFGTTVDTVPACHPRLGADPEKTRAFADRLAGTDTLNVGVVWRGSPFHLNDRRRSISSAAIETLFDAPGVRFFSLQKGGEERCFSGHAGITLWGPELEDFDETAAAIDALDLVVSVDTSVAHLAGVMHKPVWLLLPYASEWRWLEEREDTVWYPSMRLFRQDSLDGWSHVLVRVKRALVWEAGRKKNIFS